MDKQKMCFIICTNDEEKAAECIAYIERLHVPDNFLVDVLTITEATSLCSGYNAGMEASDAKYKVYLHHDVLIINQDFIFEVLKRFEADDKLGMLGMVGSKIVPKSGIMWETDRYGSLYETHVHETVKMENYTGEDDVEAALVDGFLMVTQYDVRWREDIFDKWDFYDCSQSLEFHRAGYKVKIPYQKSPWCIHDCGFVNLENYESERKKFLEEYCKN